MATYYRLNGGATSPYGGPIALGAEGVHALQYWSVDAVGNVELVKDTVVRIDFELPAVVR